MNFPLKNSTGILVNADLFLDSSFLVPNLYFTLMNEDGSFLESSKFSDKLKECTEMTVHPIYGSICFTFHSCLLKELKLFHCYDYLRLYFQVFEEDFPTLSKGN